MKTHAVALTRAHVDTLVSHGFGGVLVSFAHDKKGEALSDAAESGIAVMIDSGAFTAWTVGRTVDIYELIEYAVMQRARFPDAVIVNLDVIPGTASAPVVSDKEKRAAVRQSAKNAEQLRSAGLPVMEVYHLDEPVKVLDAILERMQPGERVALGGLARQRGGRGFAVKRRFCSATFAHLTKRYGHDELPPVHGLGIAPDGPIGGKAFPWASVDCSSWASLSQYGVGVRSDGVRLGGRSDTRVRNRDLADFYALRVLDRWTALDDAYARMWAARGVKVSA